MARAHKSHSGSLQYWPRKRAKRIYSNVKSYSVKSKTSSLMGFLGYKVGMARAEYHDADTNRKNKEAIITPVTIIECPPVKPLALRFYKKTIDGLKCIGEIQNKNLDKELERKIIIAKKHKEESGFMKGDSPYDELRLAIYTQPKLTTIGKKKPEVLELRLNLPLAEAKTFLEKKEILVNEIFRDNMFVDAHAITRGHGLQGPVRRFHISLRQKKSEKSTRTPGNLGAQGDERVHFTVAQAGQHGFHKRTEYNKLIMKIGNDQKINPSSGFPKYGLIKNQYLVMKGSIPGPAKRLIIFTPALRRASEGKVKLNEVIF